MPFWFLAPDFTFRRDGPIRLGTVLKDPLRPTLILASKSNGLPADLELPPEGSIEEANHEHHRGAGTGAGLKLWADFLQVASASICASADVDLNRDFGMVDHEVWSFDREMSKASLKSITNVPDIQKYINSGFLRRKPIFIITGIRIAKTSFTVSTTAETTITGQSSASVSDPTGTVPWTVGGEANAQMTRSVGDSYATAPGIVFAYRVHVIRTKGDGEVEEELFSHSKAFMTVDDGSGFECVEVTPCVLREGFEGKVEVHQHDAGGDNYWISA